MRELQVGDKVVHPVHGPGTVRALSTLTFVNRRPATYFVIAFTLLRTELYVPSAGPHQPPLRSAMSPTAIPQLIATLSTHPHRLPVRRRERRLALEERLKSADVLVLAGLVRDLSALLMVNLRLGEQFGELLGRARRLVVAEWALAGDLSPDSVEAQLSAALQHSARLAGLS